MRLQYLNRFIEDNVEIFETIIKDKVVFLYLYKITHIPSGRVYVGQRRSIKHPLYDNYRGSGTILQRMKKKYNWFKEFTFEILQCYHNYDELNDAEKFLIEQTKLTYGASCVNISNGEIHHFIDSDTETRESSNSKLKRIRNMPEYKRQQSERIKKVYEDPVCRQRRQVISKELWTRPEYREKQSQGCRESRLKYIKDHPNWMMETPKFYKGQQLICCNDFTSPLNGKFFPKGYTFVSVMEASLEIGFKHKRSMINQVILNKLHPFEWWSKRNSKIPVFIAKFAYC